MAEIRFRSDFDVNLIDTMGDDRRIVQAARVSTLGAESIDTEESAGLIRFLMRNRHGSPFEHCLMQWQISAPIFVWREFMRHRIASYNEESSRYRQLEPVFYRPPRKRPLQQVGKPGEYTLEPGTERQLQDVWWESGQICDGAYDTYQSLLAGGVAREVARQVLPVSIYSTAYVTMNVRALMNFLSLRNAPQALWEIRQVAAAMEVDFALRFPQVAAAFVDNGRVAP